MEILSGLGKKELIFTLGRYITYFFQIIKGFLLAKVLGPELFGVFGIFLLVQQYLVYSNFGIQYALNIKLSVDNVNQSILSKNIKAIIDSSFTLTSASSILLIITSLILIYWNIDFNIVIPKSHFIIGLLLVTILFHIQEVFLNIFRIQKKFYVILTTEILIAISSIIVIPFFSGIELLYAVIISWILSLLLSLTIFKINYRNKINWNTNMIKPLLLVGIPFLLYNISFNLSSMASRSFVAYNFTIAEMGLFTFSVSLTTAVMLVFNSVSWIIYPKLISKLSDSKLNKTEQEKLLFGLTKKTVSFVLILILFSFIFLPLIFYFLPEYYNSFDTIVILLINQIVINSTFALTSYLVGRNMYKLLIISSLYSLVVCCLLMLLFAYFGLNFVWIAFANLVGSLIFVNYLIFKICKKQEFNYKNLFNSFNLFTQINLIVFALLILYNFRSIGFIFFTTSMLSIYWSEIRDNLKLIKSKMNKR